MSDIEITFVLEPEEAPPATFAGHSYTPPRQFHAYDQFAAELGKHLNAQIQILETPLSRAPKEGLLLLDDGRRFALSSKDCDESPESLAARVFLLNAPRGRGFELLEQFRFAGAIERMRYFAWHKQRSEEHGAGVIGLRLVGRQIGALPIPGSEEASEHYALLESSQYADLPALLAAYLEQYWQSLISRPPG